MSEIYHCLTARRRERLVPSAFNGIDYLEVVDGQSGLDVTFVKTDGVAGLGKQSVTITGGIRFAPPLIDTVSVSATDPKVLEIRLKPGQLTDFSTYLLTLTMPGGGTPAGFDPESSSVAFSFKIDCPSPFDCADEAMPDQAVPAPDPDLDYTARDWAGFRQLMLDRLSMLLPGFSEDTPVDHLTTHVEALAYVADHLSYRLDAVANDTDFFRARSRIALARHARLVDYPVHEGTNARLFARFVFSGVDGTVLSRSTPLTIETALPGTVISPDAFGSVAQFEPLAFETMHDLKLHRGNNRFAFHTWSGEECMLPRGSTRATLRRAFDATAPDGVLVPGDFLILAETTNPGTGKAADADRRHRHAVRLTEVTSAKDLVENVDVVEIAWDRGDALPFDLVLSAEHVPAGGTSELIACAEAWGNVALADHGLTLPVANLTAPSLRQALAPKLDPPTPPESGRWRPTLTRGPVIRAAPIDLDPKAGATARRALSNDPAQALPAVTLIDNFRPWNSRRDLFASERFDRHFVVETEFDGTVRLRFGDDVMGQKPEPDAALSVAARMGRQVDGNIGADVLKQVVTTIAGIDAVSNPLPAEGGAPGISATRVRIEAPYAFRSQERAVTETDYEEMAKRHPGVASARAKVRWTGSWRTAFVYIDRLGGGSVERDAVFRTDLERHMDRYRLSGIDIAVRDAIPVALDMALSICVLPGALRASVRRDVLDLLGSGVSAAGRRGFFHPDNFTFGSELYVSAVIAAVMTVPGVASVEVTALGRRGKPDAGVLASGVIEPLEFEILRLDNDPNFPENGLLTLDLKGGL